MKKVILNVRLNLKVETNYHNMKVQRNQLHHPGNLFQELSKQTKTNSAIGNDKVFLNLNLKTYYVSFMILRNYKRYKLCFFSSYRALIKKVM